MVRFAYILTASCLFGILIFSCSTVKENLPTPTPQMEYLQSWEKMGQLSKGDLMNYWNNNDTANAFIQYDISIYKITYLAKELDGTSKMLSGAILVPDNSEAKSVISIQHATFFADVEAPSVNEGFSVVSRKSIFAAHGYIVFLPDYYGYGVDAENIHPYHHAESLRIASRDMILAGYEFLDNEKIDHGTKLFLAGYSEGAFATAALQQDLENIIDLPFQLTASSLGSGAYNLKATFEAYTSNINQSFGCLSCNAFLLQSYNEVYEIGHSNDYYFQTPYNNLIEEGLFLGNYDAAAIDRQMTTDANKLFNPTFITNYYAQQEPQWVTALENNSIHQWQPKHPTLLTHNQTDNVSPYFNSEVLAALNQNNPNMQFIPIVGTDHFTGIFNWGILSMDYFDRF